ncbi:hypothetical protein Nepgr_030053 [Nepenthes gracilis]|uniref:Uncharacterized protein n=1 Tax=Nepenthes gracilis TaxID=150966 RepID=A0AAD3TEN2_NEPGR|nr:hypothetical protein Nepgr_030053 [Nepenthes gracilis]
MVPHPPLCEAISAVEDPCNCPCAGEVLVPSGGEVSEQVVPTEDGSWMQTLPLLSEGVLDSFAGSGASTACSILLMDGAPGSQALVHQMQMDWPMMVWRSTSVDAKTMQNAGCWQLHDSLLKGDVELLKLWLKPSRLEIWVAANWNYPAVDSAFVCCFEMLNTVADAILNSVSVLRLRPICRSGFMSWFGFEMNCRSRIATHMPFSFAVASDCIQPNAI